jgi:hypothetical protein
MSIPILDEDSFFADALSVANLVDNRMHLEKLMEEKRDKRCSELNSALIDIVSAFRTNKDKPNFTILEEFALKLCRTRSYDSVIQFVSNSGLGAADTSDSFEHQSDYEFDPDHTWTQLDSEVVGGELISPSTSQQSNAEVAAGIGQYPRPLDATASSGAPDKSVAESAAPAKTAHDAVPVARSVSLAAGSPPETEDEALRQHGPNLLSGRAMEECWNRQGVRG